MLVVVGAIVLMSLVGIGVPIVISRSIDRLQFDPALSNLALLAALVVLLTSTSWVLNATRQWLSSEAVGDVVLKLREDAFDAVMKRDMSFYDAFPSGKLVSRVTSDTQSFSQVVVLVTDLLSQLLLVALLLAYLFSVNVKLTLITLALPPFIVFTALAFRRIARETITQSRRIGATVNSHV